MIYWTFCLVIHPSTPPPILTRQNKFVSSNRMTDSADRICLMRVKSVCHLHLWFLIKPSHHHLVVVPTAAAAVPLPLPPSRTETHSTFPRTRKEKKTKNWRIRSRPPLVWKDFQWLSIRSDALPIISCPCGAVDILTVSPPPPPPPLLLRWTVQVTQRSRIKIILIGSDTGTSSSPSTEWVRRKITKQNQEIRRWTRDKKRTRAEEWK